MTKATAAKINPRTMARHSLPFSILRPAIQSVNVDGGALGRRRPPWGYTGSLLSQLPARGHDGAGASLCSMHPGPAHRSAEAGDGRLATIRRPHGALIATGVARLFWLVFAATASRSPGMRPYCCYRNCCYRIGT